MNIIIINWMVRITSSTNSSKFLFLIFLLSIFWNSFPPLVFERKQKEKKLKNCKKNLIKLTIDDKIRIHYSSICSTTTTNITSKSTNDISLWNVVAIANKFLVPDFFLYFVVVLAFVRHLVKLLKSPLITSTSMSN